MDRWYGPRKAGRLKSCIPPPNRYEKRRKVSDNAVLDEATEELPMKMRAGRMYGFNEPLRIEEIPVGRLVIVFD
jgi:hypothetical protein